MIGATSKNGAKRFVIGLVNLEVSLIELKLCEFRNELARERILKRLVLDIQLIFIKLNNFDFIKIGRRNESIA